MKKIKNRIKSSLLLAFCGALSLQGAGEIANYERTWFGNDYDGDPAWVPGRVHDVYVTPDGRTYTNTVWDEAGGNVAFFNTSGNMTQPMWVGNHGGGRAVCANGTYIFFAGNKYRTGKSGIDRRPTLNPGTTPNQARANNVHVDTGGDVYGLAIYGSEVFASIPSLNKVRVYDLNLKYKRQFTVTDPEDLIFDSAGHLWVLRPEARKVERYNRSNGSKLTQQINLPAGVEATDIAIAPNNRLWISDAGNAERIRIYKNITSTPVFEKYFGVAGGIFSQTGGRTGLIRPRYFFNITGIGVDRDGNATVSSSFSGGARGTGTAFLESYSSTGQLRWRRSASIWEEVGDLDPINENLFYGIDNRYTLDYSKPPNVPLGVHNRYLISEHEYPDDIRMLDGDGTQSRRYGNVWIRVKNGKRVMYRQDMSGFEAHFYRFENGVKTIPCGGIDREGALWIDDNGNGKKDVGEVDDGPDELKRMNSWHIDSNLTLWTVKGKTVYRYPLDSFTSLGIPKYSKATRQSWEPNGNWTEIRRIHFEPTLDGKSNVMFLSGFTTGVPKPENWQPKRMGKLIRCYDNWSDGRGDLRWSLLPPHNSSNAGAHDENIMSMAAAGSYLFVGRGGDARNILGYNRGHVDVYRLRDKSHVGFFDTGRNKNTGFGLIGAFDLVQSIGARKRSNGEYIIWVEEGSKAKQLVYRWRP